MDEEVKVYSICIHGAEVIRASGMPTLSKRRIKKTSEMIARTVFETDGLIGAQTIPTQGVFCFYKTENEAKIARNRLAASGVKVDDKICSCWIDKR